MTTAEMEHIDLDREFAPAPASDDLDPDWEREIASLAGRIKTWSQLDTRATVILGEGGTGKTTELRTRCARVRANGQFAFFIPLADLVRATLPRVLGVDWKLLEEWKGSSTSAILFLDELDEAKLAGSRLDSVLRDVESWIAAAAPRTRLVLSCRPTEWESKADLATIRSFMARWGGADAGTTSVDVLSMLPLDLTRVTKLAQHLGVQDIGQFQEAIERDGLQPFLQRPQDVEWIVAFWHERHRFGALREMIEADIAHRLVDRSRSSHKVKLAPDRARSGARTLAAIATLSGQRSFSVRDSAPSTDSAFHVRGILSAWRPDEVDDLLRLPLFDESAAGRLRIHTRAVQEYLCAEWFRTQVRETRLTVDRLCGVLFKWNDHHTRVLAPHLARVAVWLAPEIGEVRDLLTTNAPEHLLDEGDPASLDVNERRRILRAFVAKYGDRNRTERRFAHVGLRRFASPELSNDIIELLAERPGDDVSALLLDLVAEARLTKCVDAAAALALGKDTPPHVRFAAVAATAAAGSTVHRSRLVSLVEAQEDLELNVAGKLIEALFPDPLDAGLLRRLVLSVAPRGRWNKATFLDVALRGLADQTPPGQHGEVLRILLEGASIATDDWLMRPLVEFLADYLRRFPNAIDDSSVTATLDYLSVDTRRLGYARVSIEPIRDLARESATVRRDLLRTLLARAGATKSKQLYSWRIRETPIVGDLLNLDDLQWLEDHATERRDEPLREAASALRRDLMTPRLQVTFPEREREPTFEPSAVEQLREHILNLREGHAGWLDHCVRAFHTGNGWGDSFDYVQMRHELGDEIADSILTGLALQWRNYAVPVPRDQTDGATPGEIRLGLVSLRLEVERGLDVASLNPNEAGAAARLALWELNHFPEWFAALSSAPAHKRLVEEVVIAEVIAEVTSGEPRERVISKVLDGPRDLRKSVARRLETRLLEGPIPHSPSAEIAFQVLFETGLFERERWPDVVSERLRQAEDNSELFALWWPFQLFVQPEAALSSLETA